MDTKNRLIQKLLKVAKRHKFLTYPILALVAIISVISNLFSWGTGAGKRVVAVIMVMVMLVSQSYFLTSSATEAIDDEETALVQAELQEEVKNEEASSGKEQSKKASTEAATEVADASDTKEEKSTPAADSDTIEMIDEVSMNSGASEEQASENDFVADENVAITGDGADSGDVSTDSYIDDEEIDSKDAPNADGKTITVQFCYLPNSPIPVDVKSEEALSDSRDTYTYDLATLASTKMTEFKTPNENYNANGCYSFDGKWYSDPDCTIDVTDNLSSYTAGKNDTVIKLYAKRILVKYHVIIVSRNDDNSDDAAKYIAGGTTYTGDSDFYVTRQEGAAYATFTISGFERFGYDPAAPVVGANTTANVTIASFEGGVATINVTGDFEVCNITLNWTGKTYTINYYDDTEPEPNVKATQSGLTYGSKTDSLIDGDGVVDKTGYNFVSWKTGGTPSVSLGVAGTKIYALSHDIRKGLFDGTVKIIPVYEYDGIVLTSSDVAKFEYKVSTNPETNPYVITAAYTNGTRKGWASNFTYTIVDNDAVVSLLKNTYNIGIDPTQAGINIYSLDGGPKKATTGENFEIKVTDNNDDSKSQTFPIKLIIDKRMIKVKAPTDDSNKKRYDGTVKSNINTSDSLATEQSIGDTLITVSFTKAEYVSPNAGNTKIKLEGVSLNLPSGEDPDNYRYYLEDGENILIDGSISQRTVKIKTKYQLSAKDVSLGKDYVRAGEANPFLDFEEDKANEDFDQGIINTETVHDSLDSLNVEVYTDRTDADIDNGVAKDGYKVLYRVTADGNYKIASDSTIATFNVKKEDPAGMYIIGAEDGDNAWKLGGDNATISAIQSMGYDTVHIYRSAADADDTSGIIREEDSNNTDLKIWLSDSETGAVTQDVPISVNYDNTAPKYEGYSISKVGYNSSDKPSTLDQGAPGLYFPGIGSVLDFGTYLNKMVDINVRYSDATSGVDKLYYGLFTDPTESSYAQFVDGVATIRVYRDAIDDLTGVGDSVGLIRCYAVDKAGNKSSTISIEKLKPDDISGDYEWSVEQVAPELSTLMVYSGSTWNDDGSGDINGDVIVNDQSGKSDGDMAFYNHCRAQLTVIDDASGIESIVWHINDSTTTETVHELSKVKTKTFSKRIEGVTGNNGKCVIYAEVFDNAGNKATSGKKEFRIDDVAPELTVKYDDKIWTNETTISFTTSDSLSGVDYAKVTDADGNTIDCNLGKPDSNGEYSASFDATVKGVYTVVVADKAGNTATWKKDIQMVSTVIPPCPTITITPADPNGEDGWYNAEGATPVATITNPQKASDDTPVNTQYRLWKEGETGYNDTPVSGASIDVPINDEGIFNVKAWTKSVSGVECENYNGHVKVVKVDKTAPDIAITTEKGTGASVIVNFTVTDAVSGVNSDSIVVEHSGKNIDITKEESSEGVKGSFEINETGNYTIKAADIAGNESDEAAFTPMSLKVKAVTNITDTGATVAANVIKGTFDIKSAAISYRRYADDTYTEAEAIVNIDPSTGNAAVSAALSELDPGTAYVYKVTATSDVNEILEYEGYFKTLVTDQSGISVIGTARYSDNSSGDITVGVFDGNVCLMAEEIEAGDEFTFVNVPDGNYNIVATDGTYSKTTRLLIEDGMIVYPTQYIDLVLSGMNTSVVLTTESTPGVTVDDMDTIFTNDTVNFTTKDSELIDAGGTVEFKLYATLMTVSAVSADEISAMYAVTDNNKVVGAYLDLSLYKIVTDADGDVDRSRVTNLQSPAHISVTIPLGELAGKPDLEVVRIHNDGENFIGASLADQDSNPSTYTITTDQFSTYAVLYSIDAGTTATSEQPTTANTDASTQDIDVKVVIPTGQTGSTEPTPVSSTEPTTYDDDDEDVKEIKDATKKPKASGTTTVGSLTSSGSAKTGDETPIMILFGFMMISICGVAVLRKKSKED